MSEALATVENALYLFVAGDGRRVRELAESIEGVCREHFRAGFELAVIDVRRRPELAKEFSVFAVPALVRIRPAPVNRIVGGLSNGARLLEQLTAGASGGDMTCNTEPASESAANVASNNPERTRRSPSPALPIAGAAPSAPGGLAAEEISDVPVNPRRWIGDDSTVSDGLERALAVCEAAFDAIVDKSADGVVVVDMRGTICFANAAAESMMGRSTGELLGEPFGVPVSPGGWAEMELLNEGLPSRIVEMRVVPTRWQENEAYLATLRDVTERRRAEEKAREAVRRRDEFLAILSHELRNPLAAIANAATVLAWSSLDTARFDKARGVIERQCAQMTRLLEDLLDVSRVTRRKIDLRLECLDLGRVVAEAVDAVRPHIDGAGQTLALRLPPGPVAVDADPVRLQQILVNLLSNASKYSKAGGRIELTVDIEESQVRIRVRDYGVGLSADMLEAIFEPFVQSGSTLHRSEGGLGLGLAVVDGLVRLHGGTVKADSAGRGMGSEFTIHLPLSESKPAILRVRPAAGSDGPLRLVIVEDNLDVRSMLKTLFEMVGHEVEVAGDGLHGAELIEFNAPDAALIDIGLPGLNGYALARRIRANRELDGTFLVALTGYSQPSDRKKAIAAGFNEHVSKPVDFDRLQRILASARAARRPTAS